MTKLTFSLSAIIAAFHFLGTSHAQTIPPDLSAIDAQLAANPDSEDALLAASEAYLLAWGKSEPKDDLLITQSLTHAAKAGLAYPKSPAPQVQLARGFLAWGRKEKAKERVDRALELDSSNADARALLRVIDPAAVAAMTPSPRPSQPQSEPQTRPAPVPNPYLYLPKNSATVSAPPPSPGIEVVKFATQYIEAGGADSAAFQAQFFAPVVDSYYGDRNVSRSAIEKDQQTYMSRWPSRSFSCSSAPQIKGESNGVYTVKVSYSYAVSDPITGKSSLGTGQSILKIRATNSGHEIIYVEEKTK